MTAMNNGQVDALIVYGANPVYELPFGAAFGEAIAKVALTISTSRILMKHLHFAAPLHHQITSLNHGVMLKPFVDMSV